MRRKVIHKNKFKINLYDNSRSTAWGWNKVIKIITDSIEEFDKFVFSKNTILKAKNHDEVAMDVTFCGNKRIKTVNREFRGKDKVTDVLSFPLYESLRIGSGEFVLPGPAHLGDILISRDVAKKQAHEFNIEIEQEIIHLLVHGFLHLQGWDHEISQKEEEIMESLEKSILNKIRVKRNKK